MKNARICWMQAFGLTSQRRTFTVEKYDRSLNEWRSCASMKTQRGSLGGVTVGERIYAVGGGNGMASFSEVECFDPHLASWLPCTSMLEKVIECVSESLRRLLSCTSRKNL